MYIFISCRSETSYWCSTAARFVNEHTCGDCLRMNEEHPELLEKQPELIEKHPELLEKHPELIEKHLEHWYRVPLE